MALIRPRLNDYHRLPFTQSEVPFAIPFLDDDIPLYVDPFLLWKSPSQQDNALHTEMVASFNHFGQLYAAGKREEAVRGIVTLSECPEVGLGSAKDKQGRRIGVGTAEDILNLFTSIPDVRSGGFDHIEVLQLFVGQISADRISDIACNLLKSFLVDFTLDQCDRLGIPTSPVQLNDVFDSRTRQFTVENVNLPVNPKDHSPVLLVPTRWLRHVPWINFEDFYKESVTKIDDLTAPKQRVSILLFNRANYGAVRAYVQKKERSQKDCSNDPLFKPISVSMAKRRLRELRGLPSGKGGNADKVYEDCVGQLLTSMLYPHLDFAAQQRRTDSGAQIRDLIFYNNRSFDFLKDIYDDYRSRQLVFELKNVGEIEREHVNQLNRYLNDDFGHFGVLVTRNPLPRAIKKNTIDLWSGQRRCIIMLLDSDIELMVTVFESQQRHPIEVVKRAFLEFLRDCPH